MARMEPRQELIDLKHKFSQKNCVSEFKKLYKEMENCPLAEKPKGGDYEQMISEISVLYLMIDKYKLSHIQWTGKATPDPHTGKKSPDPSQDGILYFDERKQPVEIVSLIGENEAKSLSAGNFSAWTTVPLVEVMKHWSLPEKTAREYLEQKAKELSALAASLSPGEQPLQNHDIIPEYWFYKNIVRVLEKKNKEKYKDFWLLISYSPLFQRSDFSNKRLRNWVLNEIQSKQPELIYSLKNIFKKIIFVPYEFMGCESHHLFDWSFQTTRGHGGGAE